MEDIRKISVGPDYKTSMHYVVGQKVLSEKFEIHKIIRDDHDGRIRVYILNDREEVLLWKAFNFSIPISIEFNIDF